MKKNYSLLSGLVIAASAVFAQSGDRAGAIDATQMQAALSAKATGVDSDFLKAAKFNSKAFGDTAFYEDFAGGVPTGWSIVNNNANNFQWTWNTVYQNGQFSAAGNIITSTTAGNGFMALPADFYNTPIPGTGPVAMDTYVESANIDMTNGGLNPGGLNSVWVTYQQAMRYCCSGANRLVLQVSSDNFVTFQEFDASNDIAVNAASGTFSNVINISSAARAQDSIRVRFLSEGNSHYYWMIDDFAVIEGPANDLELTSPYLEFNEANHTYYPFYNRIPQKLFPPLPFFGLIKNNGGSTQTSVALDVDVNHTAFPGGGSGQGLVYSNTTLSTPSTVLPDSQYAVLTGMPRFVPTVLGDFQVDFLATGDSIDENLGNETAQFMFNVTDTLFQRDDNGFGGSTGASSYVDGATRQPGGTQVGDRFATMYIVENSSGNGVSNIPTSVTYYVSDEVRNIGVEIVPKIWAFDDDSLFVGGVFDVDRAFGAEVASSFIPYTVTASDTMSFLTLKFDNGPAKINGLDSGQYAVGWEVTSIAGGTTFEVANDATTAALQSAVTSFVFLGHAANAGWGWVSVNPVIRLNMANLTVGLNEAETENNIAFEVAPNPNNGLFNITVSTKEVTQYNLNVRNMLGQSVYTDILNVNGTTTEAMDLTGFEKGVYFVSLENENERLLKKVVVK